MTVRPTTTIFLAIIIQHFERAPIFPPAFDKFDGTWCAHEHQEDEDTLKGIDDIEHGRWCIDVERDDFENPIYGHDGGEKGCALHSGKEKRESGREKKIVNRIE